MKNIFKKRNPVKLLRKKIKEYLFYKDKRPVFEVNVDKVYDDSEFKDRDRRIYHEYAQAIEDVFHPVNLIDMGCANGYMLEYFSSKGIRDFAGFEGAGAAFKYMPPDVKAKAFRVDLSRDVAVLPGKKFYLVNCTEVGEHIPLKYEDIFLKNIEKFVARYLVLSWANTWEDWLDFDRQKHVNPRSKRYVIKKMKNLGLTYNRRMTAELISGLKKKKNVFDHWARNIMVFER